MFATVQQIPLPNGLSDFVRLVVQVRIGRADDRAHVFAVGARV